MWRFCGFIALMIPSHTPFWVCRIGLILIMLIEIGVHVSTHYIVMLMFSFILICFYILGRVESTADDLEVGITQLQTSARCKELNNIAFVRVKSLRDTISRQYCLNIQQNNISHDDHFNDRLWVKIGVSLSMSIKIKTD